MSRRAILLLIPLLLYGSSGLLDVSWSQAFWSMVLVLAFFGVLVKWGPPIEPRGRWRLALWASLAIFCSSLAQVGLTRFALKDGIVTLVMLGLWLAAARSIPRTLREARLRTIIIVSAICFVISTDWTYHTGLTIAKRGEYYSIHFPYFNGGPLASLSFPYDVYFVYLPGRIMVYVSTALVVAFSIAYLFVRRKEKDSGSQTLTAL